MLSRVEGGRGYERGEKCRDESCGKFCGHAKGRVLCLSEHTFDIFSTLVMVLVSSEYCPAKSWQTKAMDVIDHLLHSRKGNMTVHLIVWSR